MVQLKKRSEAGGLGPQAAQRRGIGLAGRLRQAPAALEGVAVQTVQALLAGREGIGPGPPLLDDALALALELRNLLAQGRVAGIEDVEAGHGARLPEVRFDEAPVEEQETEALGG
ncbi:MAG: hypothetical protein IKT16_05135 [Desulfovibrio sp.]|nr:hypothetical protein [Desulfovibrio sp.]